MSERPDALAPALERLIAERQAERLPSVAAAVVRKGELVWSGAAGTASYEDDRLATADTQYRIGSITKTFTATAIMQLRDAGRLELDDRLDQHLDGLDNGTPTLRRLLCHLSGLQREAGEMFVTGESPTEEQLIDGMRSAEFILPPGEAHHYSNLAFALLGQVVARLGGERYTDYVDERIIRPLGLSRTTWAKQEPSATGYLVDQYARTVWREPETDLAGTAAAGQLWSTPHDLARWATFLARGADGVLDAKTLEQMCFPQVMYYPDDWTLGWGLGLMLWNHEGTVYAGHGGRGAGPPGRRVREPQDRDRRRGGHQLRHARRHGPDRREARCEDVRALARAGRGMAARGRSGRGPAAPRPLVVRGQRVRALVGGRDAEGARRRGAAGAR
ncbi:MAG TPA: serine hydrolase domain-containing protein [Gaiellaceae bacterium]